MGDGSVRDEPRDQFGLDVLSVRVERRAPRNERGPAVDQLPEIPAVPVPNWFPGTVPAVLVEALRQTIPARRSGTRLADVKDLRSWRLVAAPLLSAD